MFNRLIVFLNKNNILYNKQFGLRTGYSTDSAILCIVDKIKKAIEECQFSCGVFLDFSKAFDTVNHDILIMKLEHYGIRGIAKDWLASYLSNRKQFVFFNNVSSDQLTLSCGILQGSVLGPLLFLLYVNDFNCCSKLLDFHLFADDSNLFYKHKNLLTLQNDLNNELKNVHIWLCSNRISLNIEKSNFVIFHPPQKKISSNLKLYLNGKELKQELCIKYLGIYIDSNLNWKSQTNYIAKKIKRSIGILSKLRYNVSELILINLYYALIYPFLIYGITIWGNTYPSTLQHLYILQKKAIRIITFSKYDEHSSPLFKRLNIMKLHDLVSFHLVKFMYKFHNNLLPVAFDQFYILVHGASNYSTRLAVKQSYYLPKIRTNYGIFNIRFQGVKIWNCLEENVKSLSLSQFKKRIKIEMIQKY